MMSNFIQRMILGNAVAAYGHALLYIVIGFAIAHLLKRLLLRRLKKWAKRTTTTLDDQLVRLIERPTLWLLYLGSCYLGLQNLELSKTVAQMLTVLGVIFATLLLLQLVGSVAEYGLRIYGFIHRDQPSIRQSLNALIPAVRVSLWALGIVFVLDNLGFDISAVVQDLKTISATFWTGPQVFQTVHWNMAWREKMVRMYHLLEYTLLVSTAVSWLDIMLLGHNTK